MEKHALRRGARAARSHGAVDREHGATATVPRTGSAQGTQRHSPLAVALPVIAALGFGCYTIFLNHLAGAKGGQAALLGLIAAVVSGALGLLLVHYQSTMLTETRALAYGALFGTAMGWLYSLGGPSVLKSSAWGLVMAAAMTIVSLYLFRSHRLREPHGPHRPHATRRPHGAH
jgi:drug/metabolite transporter (DMT)-like permease